MKGEGPDPLTPVNPPPSPRPRRGPGYLIALIVAAASIAAAAALAALARWNRDEMLFIAAFAGLAAALPSVLLLLHWRAERLRSERTLESSVARVANVVESAMDAIVTVDEAQRVLQFNAAAERVFRWPRNAVIGQKLDMLLPERFRDAHRHHIEQFGQAATPPRGMGARGVLRGLRADGEEFPIEASISQHAEEGRKLFTVILRDVTLRVQAEAQLERSEARLRGILDSAMDAIITIDDRHHIVIFNKAAETVFACPRDQAIGAPLEWFIPERFRGGHAAQVHRFGQAGVPTRRMAGARIVMGLRRNGEEFTIDASISHAERDGQRFYTVILRDVTERFLQEDALRASREEIRSLALSASTAREDEKRRVARELHDELGQSLTALKIDTNWLRDHLEGASDAVNAKLATMQLMLDGTVAAARRISSELRPLMLDDLGLVAACDWLAHSFTQRTGVPCELVIGKGDLDLPDPYATAVFRVLQESLTNATKHSGATQLEVTLERSDAEVVLTVRDNGKGFALDTPRNPDSHGLTGLRERAALLDGKIEIESAPGRGTLVELRLPQGAAGSRKE